MNLNQADIESAPYTWPETRHFKSGLYSRIMHGWFTGVVRLQALMIH